MSSKILYLWIAVACISCTLLIISFNRYKTALHAATRAESELLHVSNHAAAIHQLHATTSRPVQDDDSRGSLTQRIGAAVQLAGLPATSLVNISPQAQTHVSTPSGNRISRRRVTLVISGITLPQVGAFLHTWTSTEPAWTVCAIDLTPAPGPHKNNITSPALKAVVSLQSTTISSDNDS